MSFVRIFKRRSRCIIFTVIYKHAAYKSFTHQFSQFLRPSPADTENVSSNKSPNQKRSELKISSAGEGRKGADYNPGKKNYHPIKDAFWTQQER